MKKHEIIELLITTAENDGWSVAKEDENIYRFGRYSPAGQDFSIIAEAEDGEPEYLIDSVHRAYEDFDASQEAYYWLDDTGHGINGAPYDMGDVYDDMKTCEGYIDELHDLLMDTYQDIDEYEEDDEEV
jgi:hypothetical protein